MSAQKYTTNIRVLPESNKNTFRQGCKFIQKHFFLLYELICCPPFVADPYHQPVDLRFDMCLIYLNILAQSRISYS